MYLNHTCPRCSSPLNPENFAGGVAVCSCGWSGAIDENKKNLLSKLKLGGKGGYIFALVLLAALVFDGKSWGKHYPERVWYRALSVLNMTTAKDEARMAFVCKSIEKHDCAADSYTKALKKSPQSHNLAGALGIELTKIKQFDRAILTFQNFFSFDEGKAEHKKFYALALAGGGYADDATEWFYQALRQKSDDFNTAKALISHLVKTDNHVEALSVIGHYHTLYPKTRKQWAKMVTDVKHKYEGYTDQYKLDEVRISGLSKYLHAPGHFAESSETKLFLVDPESDYLTVDLQYLQSHGIQFVDKGQHEVLATSGKSLKGTRIILPTLRVGPFTLKNVKALACTNCAFLLGKKVMKRLNFKPHNSKGVKYITLKQ